MKKILLVVLLLILNLSADNLEDFQLDQKKCNKGIAQACFNLGVSYDEGYGVKKNKHKGRMSRIKAKHFGKIECAEGDWLGCNFDAMITKDGYKNSLEITNFNLDLIRRNLRR